MKRLFTLTFSLGLLLMSSSLYSQTTYTSNNSGSWSTSSNWNPLGGPPTSADNVVIADGHTVTIDQNISIATLTVGQGTSGTLIFDGVAVRNVSISGDLTIAVGATFITQDSPTRTHNMSIGGNLLNNGIFDMARTWTNYLCNVTFNNVGNQTISGTGSTKFNNITLDMGNANTNILDVTAADFSAQNGFLTIINGTFKLSSNVQVNATTGSLKIPTTGGLTINEGIFNIGTFLKIEGNIIVNGGTLNIEERWEQATSGIATISEGTINVSTAGQTSVGTATFSVLTNSSFNMSGGVINIFNANSNVIGDLRIMNSSASITGGTFIIGQGAPTSGNISIRSETPLYNLIVDAGNTAPFLFADLTVNGTALITSGTLTTPGGKNLTVSGTLTNSAGTSGLVIKSDAEGTGSLIHNTSDVNATVQRYFTGSSWDWHLISSPVGDQPIQIEFVPAEFTANEDFYTWYEPSNIYVNYKNSTEAPTWSTANTDNNFIEGKGYLIAYQDANPTKEFTGLLNNGEQTVAITKTGSGTYSGSNLVGNPYASSIDWKATSGWTRNSLVSSSGGYDMYIWNQSANNFGIFNSAGTAGTNSVTQYIPPMQGFFVNASTNGNLTMNNDIKVLDGASNWLKYIETNIALFKIKVTSAGNYGLDEAIIEYGHEVATGGAAKMFSFVPTAPSIYLPKVGNDYSISFLNAISETEIVPLSFKAGADGNYNIEFTFDVDTFNIVQLLDKKTNIKTNLKENQIYEFMASKEDNPDRFEIHFGVVSIEETSDLNQINAYVYNNNLYIQNNLNSAQVSLYDIQGRKILTKHLNSTGLDQTQLNLPMGIYIVRLQSSTQVKNIKVFLN